MKLGPELWSASKSFYDRQTLAEHGDQNEMHAARALAFDARFPHYGHFWRYHVCPATTRPIGIVFRPDVADIVSAITQRNYTVFMYLVEALEHLHLVEAGDLGPRNRHCYIALMYAGNALQVFTELQVALCGRPEPLEGMADLAKQLGARIDPFPDWAETWAYDRNLLSAYRNYLTHQGWFYTVTKRASGESLVLRPEQFKPRATHTWTHAERDYAKNPSEWFPLRDLCRLVVDDTFAFLDLAYQQICEELDRLLANARYQALWGWRDDQDIPTPTSSGVSGSVLGSSTFTSEVRTASMEGKTSSGIDDTPGGSGVKSI